MVHSNAFRLPGSTFAPSFPPFLIGFEK